LWTYLIDNRKIFTNSIYQQTKSTLWVCANPRRVVLWEAYYLRWDPALWPVAVSYSDADELGVAAQQTLIEEDTEVLSSSSSSDNDEEDMTY
jgi:hypothetical protein